ncbi:MAG TPA: response regulator transcription factor [Myxococcaceae bacterium]|nr:response regulator transcription factor [Myxococcaceae bacterium]
MADQPRVLVVDDDPHLREVVGFALRQAGYAVEEAADGRAALEAFRRRPPALLVLDVMMPEMDGLEVCRAVRQQSRVPIIFLSSRDDEVDRILGLELGGDDYVSKPFSPRELMARVKAVLRRQAEVAAPPAARSGEGVLKRGPLSVDLEQWRAFWGEREVTLTATELQLLAALLRAPTKAFTREELMTRAYEGVVVSDRTIDSHVRRIRQKFAAAGAEVIETVHGHGYRLSVAQG